MNIKIKTEIIAKYPNDTSPIKQFKALFIPESQPNSNGIIP